MPSIICKCCDSPIEYEEGMSVVICDYCRNTMPLPKMRSKYFDIAEELFQKLNFSQAEEYYARAIEEKTDDAVLYWQKALCKFGIEYIEENGNYIPTIHRLQENMFSSDADYISALQYADSEQKKVYQDRAKQIDSIETSFLAIKNQEEPFDVFICYKESSEEKGGRIGRTVDSVKATQLYKELTQEGLKVFFAKYTLEDKIGEEYEPYIYAALHSAKVLLLLGSKKEYVESLWVKNEWSRYLEIMNADGDRKRYLIPVCFEGMPKDAFPKEVSRMQAVSLDELGQEEDLIHQVVKICKVNKIDKSVEIVKDNAPIEVPMQAGVSPEPQVLYANDVSNKNYGVGTMTVKKRRSGPPPIVFILPAVLGLLFLAFYNLVLVQEKRYNEGMALMEEGKYSEALALFEHCNYNTKDVEAQCKEKIRVEEVKNAIADVKAGKYEEAYQVLLENQDVEGVEEALCGCYYYYGKNAYDAGNYDEAEEFMQKAGTYKDAKDILLAIAKDRIKNAEVGDYLLFGSYEGAWASSEKYGQPIEWIVIDKNETGLMLLCTECIGTKDNQNGAADKLGKVIWSKTLTRSWLNNDFFLEAFNESEKSMIQLTSVINGGNALCDYFGKEANTDDYVFVLSNDEVKNLLRTESLRNIGESWWTRTAETTYWGGDDICYVDANGVLQEETGATIYQKIGVRPAMWIYFEAPETEETEITE